MRQLSRERDHLFLLHEALAEVERAPSLEARLHVLVAAIRRIGFGRVAITLRDEALDPTLIVTAGLTPEEQRELREAAAPGAHWRERLAQLDRFRLSNSYYLDSRDPWIAEQFGTDALRSAIAPRADHADWSPRDALLVPLHGAGGRVIATLVLDDPEEHARPTLARVRTVELFGQQVAAMIEHARLYEESQRERRLGEALAEVAHAVNASLQLDEVMPLIARHTVSLLRCEGATVGLLDGEMVEIVAGVGVGERMLGRRLPRDSSLSGRAVRDGRAAYLNDCTTLTSVPGSPRRTLVAPLASRSGPIGIIAALDRETPFTDADAMLLQRLADQVGIAVANAQLFGEYRALAERYRRVVQTTRDGIVITDRDRRIAFANRAAEELFDARPQLVGSLVSAHTPPEHREQIAAHEDHAFAGEPQRYETVVLRGDGERRIVSVSTSPLREPDPATGADVVVGSVASLRDVTDERRARDAVAQSEARYRNLFETASDAIYTLDSRGYFTSVNEATCELSGFARAEILGRSALEMLIPEDHARVREELSAALAGTARRFECHYVRRDGAPRLLSVSNSPIGRGGAITGVLAVARDITEERARERALVRSEASYIRLVESASDGIITVDAEGRLTSVNHALERAVGRSRGELLGQAFVELLDEEDRDAVTALLAETLAGRRLRAALRYISGRGELRHGSILTTPILEDGRVTGALGIVRDVTDEKRLAEQLMHQEKLAAVGQLVSGVAHELNNPLASVVAFSQLLLREPRPAGEDERQIVETIHDEAKRAARIVANLLTFARQRAPERTAADLNRVVTDTLELRSYAHRVQQIEATTELDPALPLTWADPFQLQQVLLNLVGNAEQALETWHGERRIIVRTERAGAMLRLSVRDTGPGIVPEHLGRIFDPFFTTKEVGQGTGLGLSISDGVAREHGGRIRVTSRPGEGATFFVELPYVVPEEVNDARPPAPTQASLGAARRILVVDDEPAIRSVVQSYFTSLGHIVDAVGSGREALARASQARYDGVLLDLRMPDLSGDVVFARLTELAPAVAQRVVFMTGDTHGAATRAFLSSAGRPVVRKPFLLDELAAVLLAAPA